LPDDRPVWVEMRGQQVPGTVLHQAGKPLLGMAKKPHPFEDYNNTHGGPGESVAPKQAPSASHRPVTHLQTGTVIHPPHRLRY